MPYTEKQDRYFHAAAERGEPGMKKLAAEADALPKLPPKKELSFKSEVKAAHYRIREAKRKR